MFYATYSSRLLAGSILIDLFGYGAYIHTVSNFNLVVLRSFSFKRTGKTIRFG